MASTVLRGYAAGFSVLYVEDDPIGATAIRKMLELIFERVYGAADGAEGVRQFHMQQPDLIVTDLKMPLLDGIEMLREVRKSNSKVPVLLMTSSLEHEELVEAINLGVSKFIAKPLRQEIVNQALLGVVKELHLERVAEQARLQEIELLQYRNRYHSQQEEFAQAKERHIARNQLQDVYLPCAGGGGWLVDLQQVPRDIMSGDSYSIMRSDDQKLLVFLADAMGHGLSAAVTSMLTTAFFNHASQWCYCKQYGFERLLSTTLSFVEHNLLEDEVFSCLLLECDFALQTARIASCGMPAVLLVRNGEVESIRSAHPPVSIYSLQVQSQQFSLEGVSDMLLTSDGLMDAVMQCGDSYRQRLADDLLSTATTHELLGRYRQYCDSEENDDDITMIRLTQASAGPPGQRYQFSAPLTEAGIAALQEQTMERLVALGAVGEPLDNLELAISEALLNAFEHGRLRLGPEKHRLILEGGYEELVGSVAEDDQRVELTLVTVPRRGRMQVWCEIADPGPGFDVDQVSERMGSGLAAAGRGFKIMRRSVGLMRRNSVGNRVLLMQMFDSSVP